MTNETEQPQAKHQDQQEHALSTLNALLSKVNARQLRENLNQLFYGYLNSEQADSQERRNTMASTHSNMIEFFTKISNLPQIDRYDR